MVASCEGALEVVRKICQKVPSYLGTGTGNKYQELAETLKAAGHRVQGVVVIPLPVRGGIPHSTRASLIALGIDTWVVDRTLSKLHAAACKQMAHLCHRRRQIEAERGITYKPGKHRRRTP